MMVVCKDRLDRIKSDQRLGREAAAAVEADITALERGACRYRLLGRLAKETSGLEVEGQVEVFA